LVVSRPKIEYMKCDFNATTQKKGDVRLDVRWYPRKSPFATWDRCFKRIEISMKMLAIELKPVG
jgi:hypothetical protein